MRIAVLADVHANAIALKQVLLDSIDRDVESYWLLGDLIGYGPDPVHCLRWLKEMSSSIEWVMGNHDAMAADILSHEGTGNQSNGGQKVFKENGLSVSAQCKYLQLSDWQNTKPDAIKAIFFNRIGIHEEEDLNQFFTHEFTPERYDPRVLDLDGTRYILVHDSQASKFRYLYPWQAELNLPSEFKILWQQQDGCGKPVVECIGHSHIPFIIKVNSRLTGKSSDFAPLQPYPDTEYELGENPVILNPGSVGQPRNKDQRSSYMILDTSRRSVTFYRVKYEVEKTVRELQEKGYPVELQCLLRKATSAKATPEDWENFYEQTRGAG